jgi:hypothetical protein
MIMSDQTKYLTENRSLQSPYTSLAKRFNNIPQCLIPDMKILMKLYHPCERLTMKNVLSNHMKIL